MMSIVSFEKLEDAPGSAALDCSTCRFAPVEPMPQVLETRELFFRPILVWGAFSLTGARLSARIYKICTPLSTGFVENIVRPRATAARQAFADAVLRGVSGFP
jgi:hypothetical protein